METKIQRLIESISKDSKQIFISNDDLKEIEEKEITIKDFKELRNIYIKSDQIKIINIENCEQLETIEIQAGEIKLIGEYKKLTGILSHEIKTPPITVEHKEGLLCWKCISIFFFFVAIFFINHLYTKRKFREIKDYHNKHCGGNKKAKKPK